MGSTRSISGVSSSQSERVRSRLRGKLRNVKVKITVGGPRSKERGSTGAESSRDAPIGKAKAHRGGQP